MQFGPSFQPPDVIVEGRLKPASGRIIMDVHAALLELLKRYVSPITAQSVLGRAMREHALKPGELTTADLPVLATRLQAAVRLFVDASKAEPFANDLRTLAGDTPSYEVIVLRLRTERDLSDALAETRRLCKSLRVRSLLIQRVGTVVSELGRNIVNYTQGGTLELRPVEGPPRKLFIRAVDSGPGIPNLDEILSGRYRSKTGLGRGLLGSKLLTDRFDIRSSSSGTIVEAELVL